MGCLHWGSGCWLPGFRGTDSSPAVDTRGNIVIGSYDNTLYSVNSSSGRINWKVPGGGESSPFVVASSNNVLIPSYSSLVSFNGSTGATQWTFFAPNNASIANAGAIDEELGLIYVGTLDNHMYAVDLASGAIKWSFATNGELWSSLGSLKVELPSATTILTAPTTTTTTRPAICFGSGGAASVWSDCSAEVICLRRSSGELVWRARTGKQIQSRPAFSRLQNAIFVGDYDYCMYALDATTGKRRWRSCTAAQRIEASPVVVKPVPSLADELVLVCSLDGYAYAFAADDGHVVWRTKVASPVTLGGAGPGGCGSSMTIRNWPSLNDNKPVAILGAKGVWALDVLTGKVVWNFVADAGSIDPWEDSFGSSPTVSGSTVYIGGEDGYLYALDALMPN